MEAVKPALEALEALITDIEKSIIANNPTEITPTDNTPADPSREAPPPTTEKKKKKKEKKPKPAPAPQVPPEVSQFLQCDLRVGRITTVAHHPEADGLYVLTVTYASGETKTVCAGLRKFITEEEMANRLVVTICNLKPRKLRGVASEAMILAGSVVSTGGDKETVVPIAPPEGAQPGDVVGAQGIEGERTVVEGKYVSSKTWDKVVPRLGVKDETACYDGKPLIVAGGAVRCKLPDGAEIH